MKKRLFFLYLILTIVLVPSARSQTATGPTITKIYLQLPGIPVNAFGGMQLVVSGTNRMKPQYDATTFMYGTFERWQKDNFFGNGMGYPKPKNFYWNQPSELGDIVISVGPKPGTTSNGFTTDFFVKPILWFNLSDGRWIQIGPNNAAPLSAKKGGGSFNLRFTSVPSFFN